MCLGIAIHRPNDVLAKGEHAGYQWQVIHNGRGYRCGYVRIPAGHPWQGASYELDVEVHGGITFAESDEPCPLAGPDDGYWIGFDCMHCNDAPDLTLPLDPNVRESRRIVTAFGFDEYVDPDARVCTQEYVESECRSLCEQAAKAALESANAPH